MDEYYARIASGKMRKAYIELIEAEDYLLRADAPEWLLKGLRRIMAGLRNRQQDIADVLHAQRARERASEQ